MGFADVVGGPAGEVVVVAPGLRSSDRLNCCCEVVLGPGLVDPGAPELVGDEQEQQEPDRDQHTAHCPEHPAHGRRG